MKVRLYHWLGETPGVGSVAVGDALKILRSFVSKNSIGNSGSVREADLVFGEEGVADAGEEHHAHQEGNKEIVRHGCYEGCDVCEDDDEPVGRQLRVSE